jgi:predicted DsbA family dithiol-disulfide isomerase
MSNSPRQRGRQVAPSASQPMQMFYWAIGIVVVVGVAWLAIGVMGGDDTASSSRTTDSSGETRIGDPVEDTIIPTPVIDPDNENPPGTTANGLYYQGDPEAPVTVVEYSDFQCPACAYHSANAVARLKAEYVETGKVRLVFHDFPLQMHPNAPVASQAARCAGEQGYFWEMHDALFTNQDAWASNPDPTLFAEYASQAGADADTFTSCLQSGTYASAVEAARAASAQAGITATPTFVVDGQVVEIPLLFDKVDAALADKGVE